MLNIFLNKLQSGSTLSVADIEINEKEFRSFSVEEKERVWGVLHTFFKNASPNQDRAYWWSYFRWYTELSWRFLLNRDKDFVSTTAVPRQLVMAILLDFDVWKEFLWYLNNAPFKEGEMQSFYTAVREATFASTSIIGEWKGEQITVARIIKDLRLANQEKNTLRIAELQANLGDILFPKDASTQQYITKYATLNQDDAVSSFTEMIHFLLGVDPSKVESVVEVIIHNEKFSAWQETQEIASVSLTNQKISPPKSVISQSAQTKFSVQQVVPKLSRPSNADIKKMVEAVFPPSAKPDFKGMVAMLNTLAEKYGNDSIRDLYVFNEQTGSFEWNVNLLR